jgi:carboxyl-terminal processing protease
VFTKDILSKPFDFTVDENFVTDPKKIDFAAGENQRREMWRKRLKYMVLDRYVELQDIQEKTKGKPNFTAKTKCGDGKRSKGKSGKDYG